MGLGGGSNSAAVRQQREDAEAARRREQERQGRLDTGLANINETFGTLGDQFYNDYRDAHTDYYLPQVSEQFDDASKQLKFNLARKGILDSTMAGEEGARLEKDKALAEGRVRGDADAAAGQLRDRTQQEKDASIAQLYATEDPDVAASGALNSMRSIQQTQPDFSALGQIFDITRSGISAARDRYALNEYNKAFYGGGLDPFRGGSGRNIV